jgi:glycosyltransferase involved in cell wall biosynthesis
MIRLQTADVPPAAATESAGLADILCISSIDFDFIWQGHQEIMSTLAARGHRVLFLENTGVRPLRLRDLPRLRRRIRNWSKGPGGFREERPNLFVFSPLVLPGPYSRIATRINRFLLLRSINRWMRATGASRPIVWTFLPTPLAHELVTYLDPTLTVYYCIDDFVSSSPEARRIVQSEKEMFRRADLVFVTSEQLRRRAAEVSSKVHLFPFGVKYEAFEAAREAPPQTPDDIARLARPIVGYVGGLHQWIDQDLVAETAAKVPEATFAFVGPPQCDVSRLESAKNVRLLGPKPHPALPHYVRAFDVGIVPYKLSDYTANVYPTKLNEYLAMGVPVVASDLAEIRRFNADHDDIVAIGGTSDQFADAVRRAIADGDPAAAGPAVAGAPTHTRTAPGAAKM